MVQREQIEIETGTDQAGRGQGDRPDHRVGHLRRVQERRHAGSQARR